MSPLHCPVSEPVGASEHRLRGTGTNCPAYSTAHPPPLPLASPASARHLTLFMCTCVCVRARVQAQQEGKDHSCALVCVRAVQAQRAGKDHRASHFCFCALVCVQAQREGKDHRVSQGCLVPFPLPFPLLFLFPGPLCPSLPLPSSPFPLLEVNLQFETECDLIFFDPRSLVKPRQHSTPTIIPYKTRDPTPVIKPSAIPRQLSMT